MGTRAPYSLVDTTPAKTILVYRNGDQFFVGRKVVLSRRRVATFEGLLEQLSEQVEAPFGVRRLYTPTHGHQVLQLDALQAGGNYIHIVPRKPAKMKKLKEIKPVVHCDMNVPSRWQTYNRISRHINVFTNGRLFIPPVKIIIPKFSLSDWNVVLAIVGEKVFPMGGVRKLFTMNGHLLDNSKDLQDNSFYVAAGLEAFKHFPYWNSPRVPSEVQQRYADIEKSPPRKKTVDSKGKEPQKYDSIPPEAQDSVYYAKEEKKTLVEPLIQRGAEGDVFKAQTPSKETQGALEVKEDRSVQVEMPLDQTPAEMVKEDEEIRASSPGFEGSKDKEDERLYEDIERKEDNSRVSFKKRFPLRHNSKKKEKRFIRRIPQIIKCEGGPCATLEEKYVWAPDRHLPARKEPPGRHKYKTMLRTAAWCRGERAPSLHPKDLAALDLLSRGCVDAGQPQGPPVLIASFKNLSKNKKVVSFPEKEPYDILERENPLVLLEVPVEVEAQEESPTGQRSGGEPSPRQAETPEEREAFEQSPLMSPLPEEIPELEELAGQPPLMQTSQEQIPELEEPAEQSPLEQPSPAQTPEIQEFPEQSSLGQPC
nr:doublecortin domain-containing protein 2C isoform X2 [Microcebus murinus]